MVQLTLILKTMASERMADIQARADFMISVFRDWIEAGLKACIGSLQQPANYAVGFFTREQIGLEGRRLALPPL